MAGELPLAIGGIAAAYYAGSIPDKQTAALVRWAGLALAGVAVYRLIRDGGSLLGGIAQDLLPHAAKPGSTVAGGLLELPEHAITPGNPNASAPAPGELIVTPKAPTRAYAAIVEPPPNGEVAIDFVGSTYSVILEVTNPTTGNLAAQEIEIQTQEHDSGFTDWDTASKPINARTYVKVPALDSGQAWRGEVKIKVADTGFIIPRAVVAYVHVQGKLSSATNYLIKRWIGGFL